MATNKSVYRVVTFVPSGAKDSKFNVVRPQGLAIINCQGESVALTVKDYNRLCQRVSDKKYCELKEGVNVDTLLNIKSKRRKSLSLEIQMEEGFSKESILQLEISYPEFSREEILDLISDYF